MWLTTRHGFFSIVKDAHSTQHLLRARFRGDIERLLKNAKIECKKVLEAAGTDYQFRTSISSEELVTVMLFLAEDNKYTNFKSAADDALCEEPHAQARHRTLMDMWDVMFEAQEAELKAERESGAKPPRVALSFYR